MELDQRFLKGPICLSTNSLASFSQLTYISLFQICVLINYGCDWLKTAQQTESAPWWHVGVYKSE